MKIYSSKFKGLKVFQGQTHLDKRGAFREIFLKKEIKGFQSIFWCMSKSKKNVLRGMHIQTKNPQEKVISVIKGEIFDVVIDCRKNSKTFGKYFKIILSENNCKSLLIPAGFAHGFLALKKENIIFYGNSKYRSAKSEFTIKWNDTKLKIKWPKGKKIISKKDKLGKSFKEFLKI